jgi:hypothetical protein
VEGTTLAAAVIVAFDSATWTATVRFEASEGGLYGGVAVSRGLPPAALVTGARCLVWAQDAAPARWIVVAVV